jgi:cell division protein FtsQ
LLGNNHIRKNRYNKKRHFVSLKQVGGVFFNVLAGISIISGMSLVFIFGYDVLTQCDYFRAQTISIDGESRLTAKEILDTARIDKGVNIFSVNLQMIRKRLLANFWIAKADVYRDFPGTIAIRITEQKPSAVLDFGRYFFVNDKGEIFKETSAEEAKGLPVVSGIDYPDWKISDMPGTPIFSSVMEVLRLGGSAGGVIPNRIIKKIHVDREMGLTLETTGPVQKIELGYGSYGIKYNRLARILSYIDRTDNSQAIQTIDLRNPDRIVACPVNEKLPHNEDKKEV